MASNCLSTNQGEEMRASRNIAHLVAAAFGAMVLLAAAGNASARNISSSNSNVRATWSSLEVRTSLVTVRCSVTLEGSFHSRTIAKVGGSLIGAITRADIKRESCTNGESLPKDETLPWHITYEGFAGTLPNINAVTVAISRFRFLFSSSGLCTNAEYGTSTDSITGRASREAGGAITTLEPVEGRNTVSLVAARELCPASGRFVGSATVTALNSSSRVTLTLI